MTNIHVYFVKFSLVLCVCVDDTADWGWNPGEGSL